MFPEDVAQKARKSRFNAKLERQSSRELRNISICCLRLSPLSGISAPNGAVAEWLKAAVC
jgi:hypothetical protein